MHEPPLIGATAADTLGRATCALDSLALAAIPEGLALSAEQEAGRVLLLATITQALRHAGAQLADEATP